jgi:hypothetical protein
MDSYNCTGPVNSVIGPSITPAWTRSWVGEPPQCWHAHVNSYMPTVLIEVDDGKSSYGWTMKVDNKTYSIYPEIRYIYHCTESSI